MQTKNTVQKVIDIIEILSSHVEGMTLTEITKELELPKTTVYDILKTLRENEIIQYRNKRTKKYGVGARLYVMGTAYVRNSNLLSIAQPYLMEIAEKYEKTTFVSKRVMDRFTFVYKYESPRAKVTTANVGDQKLLHSTSIGKCFLAFDPTAADLIETIPLPAFTKWTITDRNKLKSELEKIRKLGYSYEFRESQEHMACLAAPIYNFENAMTATISMSGLYQEREDLHQQGENLARLAKVISTQLGYVEYYK